MILADLCVKLKCPYLKEHPITDFPAQAECYYYRGQRSPDSQGSVVVTIDRLKEFRSDDCPYYNKLMTIRKLNNI